QGRMRATNEGHVGRRNQSVSIHINHDRISGLWGISHKVMPGDVRVDLILRLEDTICLVTVEIPERISNTHRGCGPSGTNASAVENGRIRIEEGNLIVKSRKVCRDLVSE